jgi:predicted Zn-dependent protease
MASRIIPVSLLMASLLLSACASNPVSGKQDFVLMSENQELALGQQAAAQVESQMTMLPERDPLSQYVDRIGQKIAAVSDRPELYYRFRIVDDVTINAFALPGGYIYIYRGLLNHMNSEAELAAVLGHEVGHVTARHAVKQYTKMQAYQLGMAVTSIFVPVPYGASQISDLLAMAVIQGYGREAELQSDELSIKYLQRAGYNPGATIGILQTLKRLDELDSKEKTDAGEKVEKYHGAFASHPETRKRIEEAIAESSATQSGAGLVNRNPMLLALNGYPYGDSPAQGAVVGRRFLHPGLGIQLEFPEDWVITNTPDALIARLRRQKVFFRLGVKEMQKRLSARKLLAGRYPARRTGAIDTGSQAGMSFAHAHVQVSAPRVSQASVDARIFLKGRKALIMEMWSERSTFDQHLKTFSRIARSFRLYDKARDGDVPRIALHKWKAGDSWQRLAGKSGDILGRFTADRLAALNGMESSERPEIGKIIKTVR